MNILGMMNFINMFLAMMLDGTHNWLETTIIWLQDSGTNMMEDMAQSVLTFSDVDGTVMTAFVSYITGPVGFTLMVAYFVKGMITNVADGKDIIIDDIAKPLFFLVMADFLITNSGTIISGFLALSNGMGKVYFENISKMTLTGEIFDKATQVKATFEPVTEEELKKTSIVMLAIMLIQSVGSFITNIFASAFLFVVLWSAKLELMMRFSFAPIGFATVADESQKHEAFRYLKKLFASAFYYVGILLILFIASKEASAVAATMVSGQTDVNPLIKGLLSFESSIFGAMAPFAAVGAVSIAKNVVNESFGA